MLDRRDIVEFFSGKRDAVGAATAQEPAAAAAAAATAVGAKRVAVCLLLRAL